MIFHSIKENRRQEDNVQAGLLSFYSELILNPLRTSKISRIVLQFFVLYRHRNKNIYFQIK